MPDARFGPASFERRTAIPIYEYSCPVHGKFESIEKLGTEKIACKLRPDCKGICKRVEWSVPAKRDSRYGEGEK